MEVVVADGEMDLLGEGEVDTVVCESSLWNLELEI